MRVLISPDKFAGTLSAAEAVEAIAEGWSRIRPGDELIGIPLADGGEGTIDVVHRAQPAAMAHVVEVADARGIATDATWLSLPDGTALVEVAQACGLSALAPEDRDPLRATTYGVGQLLRAVLASGPARVVVGLGGSATVDGGAGMISHLTGHGLRRADGNAIKVGGRWVADVAAAGAVGRWSSDRTSPSVTIAADVRNPLLGPDGAASVFGPQKGADERGVAELERALTALADVIERDVPGGPWRDLPGAGAAGGMGFALMGVLGAQVDDGARIVADLVGLDAEGCDVVITGEGSMDAQTLAGKAPIEVKRRAVAAGATTVALAGRISDGAGDAFDIAESLGADGMARPHEALAGAAARAAERVGHLS
jgi:glycerate 2-kinase